MRALVIRYYNKGLYNAEDIKLFVRVAWISAEDYKELTGTDYVA